LTLLLTALMTLSSSPAPASAAIVKPAVDGAAELKVEVAEASESIGGEDDKPSGVFLGRRWIAPIGVRGRAGVAGARAAIALDDGIDVLLELSEAMGHQLGVGLAKRSRIGRACDSHAAT
jgi:hypothetical protein